MPSISRYFRLLLPAIAYILSVMPAAAQTDAQYTQYFEVPAYYNPAAIGRQDAIRIRAAGRLQWVGIDNAPRDIALMADMPVKIGSKRIGLGLLAQSASEGLFRNLSIGLQAGYKFKLLKGEFTAAVQLGFANEVFKGSDVFIPDDDDYHEGVDDARPTCQATPLTLVPACTTATASFGPAFPEPTSTPPPSPSPTIMTLRP